MAHRIVRVQLPMDRRQQMLRVGLAVMSKSYNVGAWQTAYQTLADDLTVPAEGGVPFILDPLTAIRALTNQLNGGTTVIWLTMPALGECSPFITFSLSQSVAYETWKESQKNEHESLSD